MQIKAPLAGTIGEIVVEPGDRVSVGDTLLWMESMKVQVRIEAEADANVENILVRGGQSVDRDHVLIHLSNSSSVVTQEPSTPAISTLDEDGQQDASHPSVAEAQERLALSMDDARKVAIDKRHAKGYLSARENLALLCDIDTFQEYGQLAVAAQRQRLDYDTLKISTAADGVITGIGKINDTTTALIINDYSVLAGTQGYFHHLKLDRILEVAEKKSLPVIMYSEGGGGRPGDTDVTTVNTGLNCRSFANWAGLSGVVPRIAVANGYNFAGNAALFGAADVCIATNNSWIGMAGPAMIEGGGLGTFKPTDIGSSEIQSTNGCIDLLAEDEAHAAQLAKKVHGYLSNTSSSFEATNQKTLNQVMPENRRHTYDMNQILETVFDRGSVLELKPNYGGAIKVGFARLAGKPLGYAASNCLVLGGAIDVDAGEKMASFMHLCGQFNLPFVSFCDTPGFMVGPEHESYGAVRRLAALFKAGAQFKGTHVGVVVRKCYGLGAQALLGGGTHCPDVTFSWPSGEFGAMGLEGAVRLGFSKELDAAESDEARDTLFNTLLEQQYKRGQAIEVASVLEVDAVIVPDETRQRLIRSIN